jgi:hypothetical protein
MSWSDYLKFIEENPQHTLSLDTGMPIKGRPSAEVPKMVPPADPFAPMMSKAEDIVARARGAGSEAKKFLTEPQRLPHPVTGLPYQTKDPVTGKLGGYAMGFTPAQTAARVGLPTVGAAGAGYLGLQGAENRRARDAAATANEAPVYDLEHSVPQDFDTWGRKIVGPSAATNSMDYPANAVLIAKKNAGDQSRSAPAPAPAPAPAANEGILSKIFGGDPYKGMDSAALMKRANENPDDAAAFFRADKALRAERPEMFTGDGMATGGAAKPHKDAALHKALEIIHHLISRR